MSFMGNYQSEASIEANYRWLKRQKVRDYKVKIRRKHEPDEATYMLYVKTARTAGIITNVLPYSGQDILRRYLQSQLNCKKLFRRAFRWDEKLKELLSYDQRFCMGLRAGADEPKVVLLLALLPNVKKLYLHGMRPSKTSLEFVAPSHHFEALKRVAIRSGKLSELPSNQPSTSTQLQLMYITIECHLS